MKANKTDSSKPKTRPCVYRRDDIEEIGQTLLSWAETQGNPLYRLKAQYRLFHQEVENWLGYGSNGRYKNETFAMYYNCYVNKRHDYLDRLASLKEISFEVWRCLLWSQLKIKVQPPKEIISKTDIHTTLQFEELDLIIDRLEKNKKCAEDSM